MSDRSSESLPLSRAPRFSPRDAPGWAKQIARAHVKCIRKRDHRLDRQVLFTSFEPLEILDRDVETLRDLLLREAVGPTTFCHTPSNPRHDADWIESSHDRTVVPNWSHKHQRLGYPYAGGVGRC